MKKLTAMLLSLMMCFSLMAVPAQAAFIPAVDGSGIIAVGGPKDLVNPGDDDSTEPGYSIQSGEGSDQGLPDPRHGVPTD